MLKKLPEVDVEIVLEGSYPYITGGVSSWAQRLIEDMPDLKFGIVHLASKPADTEKLKYTLPENVYYLHNIFLHDSAFISGTCPKKDCLDRRIFHEMFNLFINHNDDGFKSLSYIVKKVTSDEMLPHLRELFYGEQAFGLIIAMYKNMCDHASFIDFFWTWRYMHIPVLQILQCRPTPAKLIHSASTGYAGVYAAIRKIRDGIPFLLSEHGIYTRERAIDILRSEAISSEGTSSHRVNFEQGVFKKMWIKFFEGLGLISYNCADDIVCLFEGNKKAQMELGASEEKLHIIPNGIDISKFYNIRYDKKPDINNLNIGFVGRVVSIKDVKTLLYAIKLICIQYPNTKLNIIGPLDEEEEYAELMKLIAKELNIEDNVEFLGRQNVLEYYRTMDVCVLTSISEGQPLIMLEAMAAGIPIVATDVGACRELIEGRSDKDKAIGVCGIITNLSASGETARAILDICKDENMYDEMAEAGKKRVLAYFKQADVIKQYRKLYDKFLAKIESREK